MSGIKLKLSREGRRIVEEARINKGWTCQDPRWVSGAYSSLSNLKRFRDGTPIGWEIFISICKAVGVFWREVVDFDVNPRPFCLEPIKYWRGVPDFSGFYGRTKNLNDLEEWIVNDSCRFVAILGTGGIGKTALAVKLVEKIQFRFDFVIWQSLRSAPPLEEFLTNIFEFLRSHSSYSDLSQNNSDDISKFMKFLRSHRCLVIFDNSEAILRSGDYAGSYQDRYQSYGNLFTRVGEEQHQSCLVLTGHDQHREFDLLKAKNSRTVRACKLEGLGEEAREFFVERRLSDEASWGTLITIYRGNPLFLKIVASHIEEALGGQVLPFLKQCTFVTGSIEMFIGRQLDCLSELEKNIMYRLARENKPVSYYQLQEFLPAARPEQYQERKLRSRLLVRSKRAY